MADVPLFHSIAQTSATFVAIIAGFYTTKIVTLSNDKRRILQRINELDNEMQAKKVYLEGLIKNQTDTTNRWDTESVNDFISYIYSNFSAYEEIHSLEDLLEWYKKFYRSITENEERILKENCPQILKELEKKRNERKERATLREAVLSLDSSQSRAISNEGELNRFNILKDKIRDVEAEILSSQKMKEYDQREYNAVAYPKLIAFGFASLITFAILGVIFPLTYGSWISFYESWVKILFPYIPYTYAHPNVLVITAFIIGLSITLIYIGFELYYATRTKRHTD